MKAAKLSNVAPLFEDYNLNILQKYGLIGSDSENERRLISTSSTWQPI